MGRTTKIFAGALGAIAVLVSVFTIRAWAPDRPVSDLTARWAPPPSTFVALSGMQVHLRDEGPRDDPTPIVLLHGTASSLHTWDGWVRALEGKHRVVRCDLPGFGLTGPFPDGDYHMPHYVAFLVALLDQLHIEHAILGGNSFGGQLAWETAVAAPGRVDKLVLVDAAGYPRVSMFIPIGFRIATSPHLAWLGEYLLPRGVVESSTRNVYGDPSKVTVELVDRYYELTLREGNRRALGQRFQAVLPGADEDKIRQVKVPTLIVWGREDHLIPLHSAELFHKDLADNKLVVFDGLGHVPHEEDPEHTVLAVVRFLSAGTET